MRKFSVFFFLVFFVASLGFGETLSQSAFFEIQKKKLIQLMSDRRDPFFAALLSMGYSGAGQFYNGDYRLGSLFLLGESTYYIANYFLQYHLNQVYGSGIELTQLDSRDITILVFSYLTFLSIKSFSMYEAYRSAERHNREIEEQIEVIRFSVSFNSRGILVSGRF